MRQWNSCVAAFVGAACVLGPGQAHAIVHELVLEGEASALTVESFSGGANQVTVGRLVLTGLDDPIELMQDDELMATVTILDGPLVVPASVGQVAGFEVRGPSLPQFDASPSAQPVLSGNISFYLEGALVRSGGGGCTNCSFVAIFGSPGTSFAFDRIEITGRLLNLSAPYTIDTATFSYQLSQPVPEPATWALWLAGLGLAGVSTRRQAR